MILLDITDEPRHNFPVRAKNTGLYAAAFLLRFETLALYRGFYEVLHPPGDIFACRTLTKQQGIKVQLAS